MEWDTSITCSVGIEANCGAPGWCQSSGGGGDTPHSVANSGAGGCDSVINITAVVKINKQKEMPRRAFCHLLSAL